jgi:hypothetical protein
MRVNICASLPDNQLTFPAGFQILHFVYVVEKFLENLKKRHCSFHIAFFEGKKYLYALELL